MCRHRVMLILSYQRANTGDEHPEGEPESGERWHPGLWQAELAALPESVLKRRSSWRIKASRWSYSADLTKRLRQSCR